MAHIITRQIGEEFNVLEHHPANMPDHLVTVKCVEHNCEDCKDCFFYKNKCMETFDKHGLCSPEHRSDGKGVQFIKIKEIEV